MIPLLIIEPPMTSDETSRWVTADESAQAQRFGSERRRREFLTWRALVRCALGADVQLAYNAVGAPVVVNRPVHISVSHCADRVAVRMADVPCAVDVESEGRNFRRALTRYMTPTEQLLSGHPLLAAAVWCAKETLYKYAGREELDLLRDIHIVGVDFAAGKLLGSIEEQAPVELSMSRDGGFIVVYI